MGDTSDRFDVIARHLRALEQELSGVDRRYTRVGQATLDTNVTTMVKGKAWPSVEFVVRDDRGRVWSFRVAVSPAGRSARVIPGSRADGRILDGKA